MSDRRITIFHFDDELGLVDWIPHVLRSHYRLKHPAWLKGPMQSLPARDGDFMQAFTLTAGAGRSLEIRYGGHATSEVAAFEDQFRPEDRDADLLILDVFHNTRQGMRDMGTPFYRVARGRLAADRIYIMTGYPDRAKSMQAEFDMPLENVFAKPPNVGAFVAKLAAKIQPVLDAAVANG